MKLGCPRGTSRTDWELILVDEFSDDVEDVHTRWVSSLAASPLHGAAERAAKPIMTMEELIARNRAKRGLD
jgi:hypothetical protein